MCRVPCSPGRWNRTYFHNRSADLHSRTNVPNHSHTYEYGSSAPNISLSAIPSSRAVTPGNAAQYTVTVTPLAGFTGVINLSASGLPAGASATFNPATVNITDASSRTSTATITTSAGTSFAN